ncbi:MAG: hypothetical protein QM758_17055 [Armatimonas sp.]
MRFAALLGVLLLIGCADPKREAHDVAQKFTTAMETQDRAQAEAQLTKAARERGMASMMMGESHKETGNAPTVGEATVEGDNARVALTGKTGDPATLLLRKEDNQWRVWGVQVAQKDGPLGPLTLNFEKPEESFKDVGRSMGEAIGGMMKGFADGLQKGLSNTPTPAPQ